MKCFDKTITIQLICLFIIFFFGCNNNLETSNDYYYRLNTSSSESIMIEKITLDSLEVDIGSVYTEGFIRIFNDSIFYIDQKLCKVYIISPTGKIMSSKLGKGLGPHEIDASYIIDYTQTSSGNHFFMGYNYNLYLYDRNWEIIYKGFLNWKEILTREDLLHNYEPSMHGLYALHFENLRGVFLNEHIYYEIYAEHPSFNPIVSDDYYSKGRIVAKINYKEGYVDKIVGRRSLVYQNYKYLGHLSYLHFDKAFNNQFYVSFEVDSLIYLCDKNLIPKKAFGISGIDMNTKYSELNNFRDAIMVYTNDRELCGYYTGLKYIESKNLLFRTYTRGKHSEYDGMQIYIHDVLVGDVNVPKGFKIEGFIDPYYYSSAFRDEPSNLVYLYKFKLKI
jgi:hypothetical protein